MALSVNTFLALTFCILTKQSDAVVLSSWMVFEDFQAVVIVSLRVLEVISGAGTGRTTGPHRRFGGERGLWPLSGKRAADRWGKQHHASSTHRLHWIHKATKGSRDTVKVRFTVTKGFFIEASTLGSSGTGAIFTLHSSTEEFLHTLNPCVCN